MQFDLPDSDRGVRPDRCEADLIGHVLGSGRAHVCEFESRCVATRKVECTFVGVNGPHRGIRGPHRESQCDRTPSATEIEQIARCRWGRHTLEQDARAVIESVAAEHSCARYELHIAVGQMYSDAPQCGIAARGCREIVVSAHASTVTRYVLVADSQCTRAG